MRRAIPSIPSSSSSSSSSYQAPAHRPPSLPHDSGVSTPVHLVQTGKIIVEERRKKFPCGTHAAAAAVLVAAASTSVAAPVEYRIVRFSFPLQCRRPGEFIGHIAAKVAGTLSYFVREVRRSSFANSVPVLFAGRVRD